jgi:hypothetical protein
MRFGCSLGILLLFCSNLASATAPILFSHPAHESPVRGDPGDLLLIAGYGFSANDTIVYQAVTGSSELLATPGQVPATSNPSFGIAPVVSTLDIPDSLTVILPTVMKADVAYTLWVVNQAGEWSNGVQINDARPFWITPDTEYATAALASLPREVKIVGRNLNPAPGAATQVRLHGPADFTLTAANDNDPTTAIEHYVAKVTLPDSVPAGSYRVEVNRDGLNWVPLGEQSLTVLADPQQPVSFDVSAYGGCQPDDGVDDTPCIVAAIAAANSNGGGAVTFAAGVWDMNYAGLLNTAGPVTFDGVLVPIGVDLEGAGAGSTVLRRGTSWNPSTASFALQGNNTVRGITFQDANVYQTSSAAGPMLRLGVRWYFARLYHTTDPTSVSGVTITRNVFDRPFVAIADGGMPIDHLLVTANEFGAYSNAILLTGDGNNVQQPFRIDDAVFTLNSFAPGSYSDPALGQGTIATQLGAGQRLDFSNNIADGTSTRYLYDSATDPRGWRAAHFWSQRGNHAQVLVSQNVATCTGDKAGDGEAVTTDGGTFTTGSASAQNVLGATANTVSIAGPLLLQQGSTTLPGGYFADHWVQITSGPGRGQVRKILSYPLDSAGQPVTPLSFTIYPAWDVIPQTGSTLVVAREYWQFYIVDNFVDQRQPLCTKANQNEPAGGRIGFYAQTADSAIEGNQQQDTSGISLAMKYSVTDSQAGTAVGVSLYSFIDVRANTVNGEYDWPSTCSWGGIQVSDGASPTPGYPPPTEGYGISIAHNSISHADGMHGGAIDLTRGWYAGPSPSNWRLQDNILVFGNSIDNVTGPPTQQVSSSLPYATSQYEQCSGDVVPRIGIHPGDVTVWNTVLSGNSCTNVANDVVDAGTASQQMCLLWAANSCECP